VDFVREEGRGSTRFDHTLGREGEKAEHGVEVGCRMTEPGQDGVDRHFQAGMTRVRQRLLLWAAQERWMVLWYWVYELA
jgi:hypothetical protein